MIDGGCEVNTTTNTGLTPLHLASQAGHLGAVEALITAGANINQSGNDGKGGDVTAIHIAADAGHHDVVDTLATGGANVDAARFYQNRSVTIHSLALENAPKVAF